MPTLPTLGKDVITNVNPVYWSVKEITSGNGDNQARSSQGYFKMPPEKPFTVTV